ncbi:MAG: response regulator transcription factor [bacterium]
MTRRVLIVEDDPDIVNVVRVYLERAGFTVEVAEDGEFGLTIALNRELSLVVLDWMLPGIDGPTFMKRLRAKRATPVIMLTARGEEADRLTGFEVGVDDYVAKPFSPKELVARVKAVLARTSAEAPGERVLHFGSLTVDPAQRSASVDGRHIELTTREFDMLLLLSRNPQRVFSRDELLERIWGREYEGVDRVVDVHVSNVRAKIERDSSRPHYIQTVRGAGYKFAVDEGDGNE